MLKGNYWGKVWKQMQKEIYGDAVDTEIYPRGDYLQAVFSSLDLDVFISNLIAGGGAEEAEDGEEPDSAEAMNLMSALRTQEFGGNFKDKIDVGESVLLSLWQQQWWEPMLEGSSSVSFEELVQLAERFRSFDIATRREFAKEMLGKWDKIMDCFWAAREAHDQDEAEKKEQ